MKYRIKEYYGRFYPQFRELLIYKSFIKFNYPYSSSEVSFIQLEQAREFIKLKIEEQERKAKPTIYYDYPEVKND